MTDEQKAALDLAILNLRTHGDDQLLSAVQPLIEFYESRVLAERKEPMCEQCGDGIVAHNPGICGTCYAIAAPLANPSDKQEAVAEIVRYETFTGRTAWDIKIRDTSLKNGALLYAAPLAQSAEQDRIDAERYRWLRDSNNFRDGGIIVGNAEGEEILWDTSLDAAKGASK
jgi:hypothetical protein